MRPASPPLAAAVCGLLLAWAQGCGRIGFDEVATNGARARPSTSAPDAAEDLDASSALLDGGTSVLPPAIDAATDANGMTSGEGGTADASLDASTTPPAPDAAPPDAGPGTGPDAAAVVDSGSPSSGPLVCADLPDALACGTFAGGVSPNGSAMTSLNGTITASSGYLAADTTMAPAYARLLMNVGPYTSGLIYLRFKMRIPSGYAVSFLNFAALRMATDPTDFGIDLNLVNNGALRVYSSGDDRDYDGTGFTVPRDQWMCVNITTSISDTAGAVRIDIDGTTRLDFSGIDTRPPGGIEVISVGVEYAGPSQNEAHVDIDDLVATRSPLGACD